MANELELQSALREAIAEIEGLSALVAASGEPVAIIGIGCRLPGAESAEAVWNTLSARTPLASDPPSSRARIAEVYSPNSEGPFASSCARAAYLDGIDQFDAAFFRMLPQQATALDPQHRLLLETGWNAIEDAGIAPLSLKGQRVGVFVGLSFDDYAAQFTGDPESTDPLAALGSARSLAAGRLSYFFDFKGPSVQLDTACSSSAVAIHQAVRSLRNGECNFALAGGANAIIDPQTMIRLSRMNAISPDGRCRSFDAHCNGYGRGEGGIMFLLARLSEAQRGRYRIHGIIRGSAVNHDGASNGLTAPNGEAQVDVVRAAFSDADADVRNAAFIETHGTGTPLGDPIEATALQQVFAGQPQGSVPLSASKSVFGHLEAAAGAMGVLSATLALNRGHLPGQPQDTTPTHRINWADMPLHLAVKGIALDPNRDCAGVSSFGMSGTNTHIVLEKPPEQSPGDGAAAGLVVLAAHSADALRARARDLHAWLLDHPDVPLCDIERSLLSRSALPHRVAFLLDDKQPLLEALGAFGAGDDRHAFGVRTLAPGSHQQEIDAFDDARLVAEKFLAGANFSSALVKSHPGHPASLPPYPFQRTVFWKQPVRTVPPVSAGAQEGVPVPIAEKNVVGRADTVKADLRALLAEMLELSESDIDDAVPFIEIGADSLILLDAVRIIEQRYAVTISMGDLFGGLSTLNALADHIEANRTHSMASPSPVEPAHAETPEAVHIAPKPQLADTTAGSAYFSDLVARFSERHAGSKTLADVGRRALADSRRVVGFRPSFKEALFPIVGARGDGAHFWDIDDNKFVDTAMGFGVYLFGHNHGPIEHAITEARLAGRPIGPQSADAAAVAMALCDLTGFERAAFCNTGTEAIMTALRLARAGTRRNSVALFSGSYHGHFDGVLGAASGTSGAVPAAPGVTSAFVSDLMVLDYGAESALDAIAKHGSQLAAVLVEPVQSRAPDLQPVEFLSRLRALADRHGFALIFDEVLTGLRVHPEGAHGLFGVKPDIATYGKILGGGLPIGAVAGKARFLDGIDGGNWAYGDDSGPTAERVFFGGTFNKNALSMAAARSVLHELTQAGPGLQEALNNKASAMIARLVAGIEAEDLPVTIQHFGSLYRYGFNTNPDAFYLELANRGVYVWEGRNCFLSTAHTEADIDHIVDASLDSLRAMKHAGLLQGKAPAPKLHAARPKSPTGSANVPALRFAPPHLVAEVLAEAGLPALSDSASQRERHLNTAATSFAHAALANLVAEAHLEGDFELASLQADYKMSSAAGSLLESIANWLLADGRLVRKSGKIAFVAGDAIARPDTALAAVRDMGGAAEAELLTLAGYGLADILKGRKHPLEVLATGGDFSRLAAIYSVPELARLTNQLFAKSCAAMVAPVPADRPLRILELGAGTGSATGPLLAAFGDRALRYHVTDASTAFFDNGRWRYPDPRLTFGRYDIEKPASAQGLDAASYDLIIASNIMHVARDLDFALEQAAGLLAPGGVLALHELTATPRWLHLIFGLTDGWWQHNDVWRGPDSPLLDAQAWRAAMQKAGLSASASVAAEMPGQANSGAAVILGRKSNNHVATRAQQELFALASIDEEGGQAYNLALAVDVEGNIDIARLAEAIDAEAAEHDALRAVFTQNPIHMIFDGSWPQPCAIEDWRKQHDQAVALEEAQSAFGDAPFDLSNGPLFRSKIIRLGEDRCRVLLAAPHIVADAMSLAIVWQGAVRRYDALDVVQDPPAFAEYLASERQWTVSAEADTLRAYWSGRVPTVPGPLIPKWAGSIHRDRLPGGFGKEVRQRAADLGMTPFMLHYAAFSLAVRAHNPGVAAIGVPVSGRSRAAEGLVGYCTHVLPVAVPCPEASTIGDYLAAVRAELVNSYAHQALPFAEMPRTGTPHIEVTFNLDVDALPAPLGTKARFVGWQTRHEPFAMRVNLTAEADDLSLEVGYQHAHHDENSISGITESYRWFLSLLLERDPGEQIPVRTVGQSATPHGSLNLTSAAVVEEAHDLDPSLADFETCLTDAMSQILGVGVVDPHDDFFEMGGDSIMSMQVAALVRRAGFVVEARSILEFRTARAVAHRTGGKAPRMPVLTESESLTQDMALAGDEVEAVLALFEE